MSLEHKFKAGQGFLFYIAAYCVGRLFIESMRVDAAHTIAGLRVNVWMSMIVAILASFLFWRTGRRRGMLAADW